MQWRCGEIQPHIESNTMEASCNVCRATMCSHYNIKCYFIRITGYTRAHDYNNLGASNYMHTITLTIIYVLQFNVTQAATYGAHWDKFLPGVIWAYRSSPHDTTEEKPSFLLFGIDCHTPTEAVLFSITKIQIL